MSRHKPSFWIVMAWAATVLGYWLPANAQRPPTPATAPAAGQEMVQLNFPPNSDIKLLVSYVISRLKINIVYDEALMTKRVTISSPERIPKESLLSLLQSVLKMANLALVDGEQPGWKKIVPGQNLLGVTSKIQTDLGQLNADEGGVVVTQVFTLANAPLPTVDQMIKPLLTQPGGNSFMIGDKTIAVTDYAAVLRRVSALVDLLDKARGAKTVTKFVPVKYRVADELAREVTSLLTEQDRLEKARQGQPGVFLFADSHSNQIILIAFENNEKEATNLIALLDTPSSVVTKTYRLKNVTPDRVEKLARDWVEDDPMKKQYKFGADDESGLLVVTAAPAVHDYVEALVKSLDVLPDTSASNIRFYRLMNTTAAAAMATIVSLNGGETAVLQNSDGATSDNSAEPAPAAGGLNPLGQGAGMPPMTPNGATADVNQPPGLGSQITPRRTGKTTTATPAATTTSKTKDALVTADVNTNTIIVIAPAAVQESYRRLITILDKRRPQVMIEVTLVTLDKSKSLSIGMDSSIKGSIGGREFLVFNAFGLSTISASGAVTIDKPTAGFNGVLLEPEKFNAVVKALATESDAKIVSSPKVLVNDNATATLESLSEAPFTSINASTTVSTTSFAGYASAGITVTATPHISEGNHLQLKYTVMLSSFTGGGGDVPPPRQTNVLDSEVTIPDGYTIVVGGLSRKDVTDSGSKVPFIGDIPLLKYLVGSYNNKKIDGTLFVFLRPTILRDDEFEDLKYLSEQDLRKAQLPANAPRGEPLMVE